MDELKPMLKLTCAQARIGYGGILRLDLGELVEYQHPRLRGKFYGTWRVVSRYSAWRIRDNQGLVAGAFDDDSVQEAAVRRLEGHQLLSVELSDRSSDTLLCYSGPLFVDFLEITSTEENWEAFGPEVHLAFGPGPSPAVSIPDEQAPGLTPDEFQHFTHADECARRWKPAIPPELASCQGSCQQCAYFMALRGVGYFGDFGLCTNPSSRWDGKVSRIGVGCVAHADELSHSGDIRDA